MGCWIRGGARLSSNRAEAAPVEAPGPKPRLAKLQRLAFHKGMNGGDKNKGSPQQSGQPAREARLAAALRENLRRRKDAKNRRAPDDNDDDEGPVDDRD
jgi:hypothetical protein